MKSSTPKNSTSVSANMAQLQARAKELRLAGLLAHWDTLVCDPARLAWVTELLDWELKFDTSEHFSCNWRSPAQ
jgi:hypothetical protein